jgi:membrane protein
MNSRELYILFKASFKDWLEDSATIRAAALTFFIILPLPTLLLLAVQIFALFFGQSNAINIVILQISAVVGPAVAGLFYQLLVSTGSPFTSVWTAVIVIGFSIGGAIGAFSVLRDTMDCIWEVTLRPGQPLWKRIRQKIVPFALVSMLGLIVIAWTAIASSLFNAIKFFSINSTLTLVIVTVMQLILSFVVASVLLAIIYKTIPEAKVHWQETTIAAITTGVAFTITNYAFGTYISTFTPTTVAGAAGALLIILLWIFVLNQIVLFGGEVSKVYATTVGTHAKKHRLPASLGKIALPIQKAGEKMENAVKEDVVKTGQPTVNSENKTASPDYVQQKTEAEEKSGS